MFQPFIITLLLAACTANDFDIPHNVTRRSPPAGVKEYRSALTLDWLDGEDARQREMAQAYETERTLIKRGRVADCVSYSRPAPGKVARLMLELLKDLEGDDGPIIIELIQALMRNKLLVETSRMDKEPDLDSLVQTPGVMMGEPHVTIPRIIALVWMITTDPVTTKKEGWCPIKKLNQYLTNAKPSDIAKQMHDLDPIIARARFTIEDFIRNVTPLNIFLPETATTITTSTTKNPASRTPKNAEKGDKGAPQPFPLPFELTHEKGAPPKQWGHGGADRQWDQGSPAVPWGQAGPGLPLGQGEPGGPLSLGGQKGKGVKKGKGEQKGKGGQKGKEVQAGRLKEGKIQRLKWGNAVGEEGRRAHGGKVEKSVKVGKSGKGGKGGKGAKDPKHMEPARLVRPKTTVPPPEGELGVVGTGQTHRLSLLCWLLLTAVLFS